MDRERHQRRGEKPQGAREVRPETGAERATRVGRGDADLHFPAQDGGIPRGLAARNRRRGRMTASQWTALGALTVIAIVWTVGGLALIHSAVRRRHESQ